MAYQTFWEENGICWKYTGDVTAEEISESQDEFFADYRSKNARYQIIDASAIDSLHWDQSDIVETSANDVGASMAVKDLKIAFVVSEDPEVRKKIDAYIDLCKEMEASWTFGVFKSMDAARAWIKSFN